MAIFVMPNTDTFRFHQQLKIGRAKLVRGSPPLYNNTIQKELYMSSQRCILSPTTLENCRPKKTSLRYIGNSSEPPIKDGCQMKDQR